MSYTPGTILSRKTPFEDDNLTAYNEVEVIGPSPVQTGVRSSEFAGQLGDNLSVKPAGSGFGEVIDRPFGELQRDYDVKSAPAPRRLDRGEVSIVEPGPSPEEVFAAESGETPAVEPVELDPNAPSPEDVFAAQDAD